MTLTVEILPLGVELIEVARRTEDALYLGGVHKVASVLLTRSEEVLVGSNIKTRIPFADMCGEMGALSEVVVAGHRDPEVIVAVRTLPGADQRLRHQHLGHSLDSGPVPEGVGCGAATCSAEP